MSYNLIELIGSLPPRTYTFGELSKRFTTVLGRNITISDIANGFMSLYPQNGKVITSPNMEVRVMIPTIKSDKNISYLGVSKLESSSPSEQLYNQTINVKDFEIQVVGSVSVDDMIKQLYQMNNEGRINSQHKDEIVPYLQRILNMVNGQ